MRGVIRCALGLSEAVEMPHNEFVAGMNNRVTKLMDLHPDWPLCEVCFKPCDPKTSVVVWHLVESDEAMTPAEAKAEGKHLDTCWIGNVCFKKNPQLKPYLAPKSAAPSR